MLTRDNTVLIGIDFQKRIVPYIRNQEKILKRSRMMVRAATVFEIPVLFTEQRNLGSTVPEIGFNGPVYEKSTFSCCKDSSFYDALKNTGKRQSILIGIETHICVLQTAFDLLEKGYDVHIAVDCTGSRHMLDHETALMRLSHYGAVPTTAETVIYELLVSADETKFKEILPIIKEG